MVYQLIDISEVRCFSPSLYNARLKNYRMKKIVLSGTRTRGDLRCEAAVSPPTQKAKTITMSP